MNKTTSFYLDLLRVIAAFGVVLVHASLPVFSNSLFLSDSYGHKFVMIFFVLSGYLIAFTADKKNKGYAMYLTDRFSRLYSVIVPALILTFVLDFFGSHHSPYVYQDLIVPDHQLLRYFLNLTFLSQIWGLCTKPGANGAFWSIPYEFWYYMIFGAFTFIRGYAKWIVLFLIFLITGLKILVLLPVWAFGALVYYGTRKDKISKMLSKYLFFITLSLIIFLTVVWDFSFFDQTFLFGQPPLFFSSRFVFDWVYGLLVALNIYFLVSSSFTFSLPRLIEKPVKYLSSITFSLYLYHGPALLFAAAFIKYDKSNVYQVTMILLGIVFIVSILSEVTEKQRLHWKELFSFFFYKLSRIKSKSI